MNNDLLTINNEDEFEALLESCDFDETDDCFCTEVTFKIANPQTSDMIKTGNMNMMEIPVKNLINKLEDIL